MLGSHCFFNYYGDENTWLPVYFNVLGTQAYYFPLVYPTYPFNQDDGYDNRNRFMPPGFINSNYWVKNKIRDIKRDHDYENNSARPNVIRKMSTKFLNDGHEIKHKVIKSSNKPPFEYIKIKSTESNRDSYNPFKRSTTKYHHR